MNRRLLLIQIALCALLRVSGAQVCAADTALRVSLLAVTPGADLYSAVGHAVLRVQDGATGADLCYSYVVPAENGVIVKSALGLTMQALEVRDTGEYFSELRREGRGIVAYTLALTHREAEQVRDLLEKESSLGACRRYDYLNNGCALGLVRLLSRALGDAALIWPAAEAATLRSMLSRHMQGRQWAAYFMSMMFGADTYRFNPDTLALMVPESLGRSATAAVIARDGIEAPLVASVEEVIPAASDHRDAMPSPTVMAAVLLAAVLCSRIGGRYCAGSKAAAAAAKAVPAFTVALVGALSIPVWAIGCFSDMYGARWNMLMLVYNILPPAAYLMASERTPLCASASRTAARMYLICNVVYTALTGCDLGAESIFILPHWLVGAAALAAIWPNKQAETGYGWIRNA